MKIISKYKDYYDYLLGTLGEDPLIILDRREFENPYYSDLEFKIIDLHICDVRIQGLYRYGKFYYGDAIKQFSYADKYKRDEHFNLYYIDVKKFGKTEPYMYHQNPSSIEVYRSPIKSDVNSKLGCPILLFHYEHHDDEKLDIKKFYKFPKLQDLGIQSYLTPETIWHMLTEFMKKKDIVEDNRTNNEKILTAGFDLKESFRGKI
jgi:hypothetical protein